jgi:site-specific DNA-methyltransferase (adenine-specific)
MPNREREHPNEKPVQLVAYFVKNHTLSADTIIDPFMGSGTTGVACVNLGRKFIGIELEPKYFDVSVKRIRQAIIDKQNGPLFAKHEPPPQTTLFGGVQ